MRAPHPMYGQTPTVADDDLAAVAAGLYALPPEQFTAARDAAAKQAPALRKAIKALRRPTASAWLVNRLARDHAELLEPLLGLGPALAAAQATGNGGELRALGQQRRELIKEVTATAVGDDAVSAAVRTEVEQTLEAALTDPAAAEAVRSGTLVRPLSFAGFGGVDMVGAVALARPASSAARSTSKAPATPPTDQPQKGRKVEQAEQATLETAAALDDAVEACRAAERRRATTEQALAAAEQQREELQRAAEELERQLAEARDRLEAAGHAAHDARQAHDKAMRAVERASARVAQAQEAAEKARRALDGLRRG